MKYTRLHPGKMSNEDLLSLLRKNLQCLHGCLDMHFDAMFQEETHWLYAISGGGVGSCVLGQVVHVVNCTGQYACLISYDPSTTQSSRVPVVLASIKLKDKNDNIVLLLIHEPSYLAHSNTSLLLEYQICQYGKIIDSCSKNHVLSTNPVLKGTQRFQTNDLNRIDIINQGGLTITKPNSAIVRFLHQLGLETETYSRDTVCLNTAKTSKTISAFPVLPPLSRNEDPIKAEDDVDNNFLYIQHLDHILILH